MFTYVDIETAKARTNIAGFNEYAGLELAKKAREIKAPSNYKDPEKIAAYIESKREELNDERDKMWHRTSLDGGFGEVICICWAVGDGPVQEAIRPTVEDSEAECIATFFAGVLAAQKEAHGRPIHWVGSKVLSYDLRVLWQRCVVLGVPPPVNLRQTDAPWKGTVVDTCHMWRGRESMPGSLDYVCKALGIDVGIEDTIDGSMVDDHYKAGDFQTILTHCRSDVEKVRAVHRRMMFMEQS